MKLALMCRNANLYSHKRLVEAAEARGHEISNRPRRQLDDTTIIKRK